MSTPSRFAKLTHDKLLAVYSDAMRELRRRGIVRSYNNPVADFAERLAAVAFGFTLQGLSNAGYDGISRSGIRYQVKCRRVTSENKSQQLSPIRNFSGRTFDYLVAILFDEDFSVRAAYRVERSVIRKHARFSKHVNGHILVLRDVVLAERGVRDVTMRVRGALKKAVMKSHLS